MEYSCGKCGRRFKPEDLKRLPWVRCPYCDSKIIYKARPSIVKKIKAT